MLKRLHACAQLDSISRRTSFDHISTTTKKLLEERRELRLNPNATHLERLMANICCRKALQKHLEEHRKKRTVEAAQRKSTLKKCRRDLTDHSIPFAALRNEDGLVTISRFEMESIAKLFYTNLFRFKIPIPNPVIPAGGTGSFPRKYELRYRV
ncbi:unnamed protein product [Heligmosomoides polygyrus]|uniref:Uncharacterized protein n=1 Tax=Heligmosomoides polygyrus TaxID=6339 RepID=A0A3P8DPQ4_HELPZ|nr:unnamed protein product [Heligmosomoides polygyrus]